jgi:hypothetical protein
LSPAWDLLLRAKHLFIAARLRTGSVDPAMDLAKLAAGKGIASRCRSLVSRRNPVRDLLLRAKHLFVAANGMPGLEGGSRSRGHTEEFSGEPPCWARRIRAAVARNAGPAGWGTNPREVSISRDVSRLYCRNEGRATPREWRIGLWLSSLATRTSIRLSFQGQVVQARTFPANWCR